MQFIPRDVGGTIRWRAPLRATATDGTDATPTVIVYNEGGGEAVASANATLHVVNTTTSSALAAGGTTLTITSATGVVRGDELLLGPNIVGESEFVKIKGVDSAGLTIVLAHPSLYTYASGVSLEGTYQSTTIAASVVAKSYQNWRAVFSWLLLGVQQGVGIVRFDVIRHWISHQPCTLNDLRSLDPLVTQRMASTYDWEAGLDAALNLVIRECNQNLRAAAILADDDWRELVALRFLSAYVGPALGERGDVYTKTWESRYRASYAVFKPQLVSDEDEDGAIATQEKGRGLGGELHRG